MYYKIFIMLVNFFFNEKLKNIFDYTFCEKVI